MIDTHVNLGGLELASPFVTASGTFGYGTEYLGAVDYSKLGAVTAKGVRMEPWPGNPMPRHAEVPGGLVNAIGLQGSGVRQFLNVFLPYYRGETAARFPVSPAMIANIWGGSPEEYAEVAAALGEAVEAIEINVSCPNVKEGGHVFGHDPALLGRLVAGVRLATSRPLIVKLAPNVSDIRPFVTACEEAGADALNLINTLPAMVIDIERRRPAIANRTGGLSGRAVHPVAVKLVNDAHRVTKLPILATGGVYEAKDAIEFFLAGATAVALGTAIFSDPGVVAKVYDGTLEYCERQGFKAIRELTGALCES